MRNQIKITWTLIVMLTLAVNTVIHAGDLKKVAQSGMQYLKIGLDAQMVGRGEAGISSVKGLSALYWNPAGLADMRKKELSFSHNAWIADISLDALAIGYNMGHLGAFSIDAVWVDYGELLGTSVGHSIEESSAQGYVDEGTFRPIDLAVGIGYARKVSNQFSIGGHVRYLYEDYGSNVIVTTSGENETVQNTIGTLSFSLGTWYQTGFKSLALSMTIQNFSPDIRYEYESFSPPLTFKMGVSMDLLDFFNDKSRSRLLFAIDAIHPRDYTERINVGMEYDLLGILQLRSGYRMNYDEGELAFGGGVRYSMSDDTQLRLDMSYLTMASGRFDWPMQITAGLSF